MANSNSRQFGINNTQYDDPQEPGTRAMRTDLPDDLDGDLFTTPPVCVQSAPQPTYRRTWDPTKRRARGE